MIFFSKEIISFTPLTSNQSMTPEQQDQRKIRSLSNIHHHPPTSYNTLRQLLIGRLTADKSS